MICISILPSTQSELTELLARAQEEADLVELRVDSLEEPCPSYLKEAISQLSIPLILTLRSRAQGGFFEGKLIEHLTQLAQLEPAYLDVEEGAAELIPWLRKHYPKIKLIASRHILHETPADLEATLQELQRVPADVYKLVSYAQSSLDALRCLDLSRKAGPSSCVFAMGDFGSCTRILSPVVQNPWTYASLESGKESAPGQLCARKLRGIYHHDRLNAETQVCGLIGDPISASPGYLLHNRCYHQLGLNAVYVSLRVQKAELKDCLALIQKLKWRGLSVTIPHKELVQACITELEPRAASIGAVNTLTFQGGCVHGANSDASGALDAIEAQLAVQDQRILILGAGGAVRAIAFEAKERGAQVVILARRLEQAQLLAQELGVVAADLATLDEQVAQGYRVLINATPVDLDLPSNTFLPGSYAMDLRSKPKETAFLQAAVASGCTPIYGIDMFTRQAAVQIEHWFPGCSSRERLHTLLTAELPQEN